MTVPTSGDQASAGGDGTSSIEEVVNGSNEQTQEEKDRNQLAYYKELARQKESELRRLRTALGKQEVIGEMLTEAVRALPPFIAKPWEPVEPSSSPIAAVLNLSDVHVGEWIDEDEVGGINAYSWDIAQESLISIADDFLSWVWGMRGIYNFRECHIVGLGDYISGDIHGELLVTNEFPSPVQTANAGMLLAEVARILAGRFPLVKFHAIGADNHSRLTRKPQFKQKALNSYSYLVHKIIELQTNRLTNFDFKAYNSISRIVEINKKRFLCKHGDTIKAHMGIPYYGIMRDFLRETRRAMMTGKPFDYELMGHWHVPAIVENDVFINGSVCGTTELDHGLGRFSGPAQTAFMVHPSHGVFNFTPFRPRNARLRPKPRGEES